MLHESFIHLLNKWTWLLLCHLTHLLIHVVFRTRHLIQRFYRGFPTNFEWFKKVLRPTQYLKLILAKSVQTQGVKHDHPWDNNRTKCNSIKRSKIKWTSFLLCYMTHSPTILCYITYSPTLYLKLDNPYIDFDCIEILID